MDKNEKKAIDLRYTIKVDDKYVERIEVNDNYAYTACAPTMGTCHTYSEYTVILGDKPILIERLTAASYLKVLFEEFRWREKQLGTITIEPVVIKGA